MHININNRVCNYSNNLIESGKEETENILISEKNYKNLVIYFTSYVDSKQTKMLSLNHDELMGKIEDQGAKNI